MRNRTRAALLYLMLPAAFGLLEFSYRYLDFVSRQRPVNPLVPLIEQMTGCYGTLVLVIPTLWLFRRYGLSRWPLYAATLLLGSIGHTLWNWGSRVVLFPLFGLLSYDYGAMPARFLMEFPADVILFTITIVVTTLYFRQVRATELEKSLAQAQLHNLRLQLHPHFLFNTLNTISAVMYEDVPAADRMLARLSDLLRMSLEQGAQQEVTLERELEFLRLYVETMQARFEDRLTVDVDAPAELLGALVPPLVLQPLVENSITHGADPKSSAIAIRVRAHRENGTLHMAIRDHGPGLNKSVADALTGGIGLSNTAQRLERLYGIAGRLALGNAEGGGLVVSLEVPFHADSRPAGG
ncbi:MAG TPA: histidine kinase [Bryobacteraceae bacterium]|nr:histidine kinase [Bryobacteraceae bacterium]